MEYKLLVAVAAIILDMVAHSIDGGCIGGTTSSFLL